MVLVVISFLHGTGQSCVGEYTQSEAREFHPTLRLAGERWQDTGATQPRGRSLRTGEVIDKRWLRFSFPTFWHYDILRGLGYLRNAGIKPDSHVGDAIEVVIERRHQNGRWPLNLLHPEHIPSKMGTDVGMASRWNTLRALRVLRWYNNSTC